jgi:hypothetical protein
MHPDNLKHTQQDEWTNDLADLSELFAEELPEQADLVAPATSASSLSSLSSFTCPSSVGSLTTVSSLG